MPAPRLGLYADALEQSLRTANDAIEGIGVACAVGDDAVLGALAIAPDAGVQVCERSGVVPRALPIAEIERPGAAPAVGSASRR